jgi:hypothetical protein
MGDLNPLTHPTRWARASAVLAALALLCAAGPVRASPTRVLMLYDSGGPASAADWMVPAMANLLGHFETTITTIPAWAYRAGEVEGHEAVIYLGLEPRATLPEPLLTDIYDTERPVCWLGHNLEQLSSRFSLGRYGFRIDAARAQVGYQRVLYRGQLLKRGNAPLTPIAVSHPAACRVLATTEGDGPALPYAVRSGRFWYFADLPLTEFDEAGSYLVLCDQLHEILGQRHSPRRTALLCITDVAAETDPGKLRKLIGYLQREKLPFAIAVTPLLCNPERGIGTALGTRRAVVGALRQAQRSGAAIIAYGYSHGLGDEAGSASEFWDPVRNAPLPHRPASDTRKRMEQAIAELARCGLYPLAWATPGGRASSADYAEMAQSCSTVWERRLPGALAPGPQVFPFLVRRDSFGQRVIPDNLRALHGGSTDIEPILEQARCQTVLPDPWLTAPIAADAPLDAVKLLVAGLRAMSFEFADLRRERNWMKGSGIEIHSQDRPERVAELLPARWDATILGPGWHDLARYESPANDGRAQAMLRPGAILVTYPSGSRPKEVFAFEGESQELAQRAVSGIARGAVIFAVLICLVLIVIYLLQVSLQRRS